LGWSLLSPAGKRDHLRLADYGKLAGEREGKRGVPCVEKEGKKATFDRLSHVHRLLGWSGAAGEKGRV